MDIVTQLNAIDGKYVHANLIAETERDIEYIIEHLDDADEDNKTNTTQIAGKLTPELAEKLLAKLCNESYIDLP
ncbi:hypothetical protein J5751_04310 [bacterium]|nr:hypothetical protein [bacterium]